MAETLASYLVQVRRLLHDVAGTTTYYTDADLTADLNKAVAQRDMWTGGSRAYQANVALTAGQEIYKLSVLFPTLLTVLDVISVWLIYGNTRVALDNPSLTDLTTRYRPLVGFQNRPAAFARFGADSVFIAPAPTTAYTTDWDLVVLSTTLVNPTDADPLPFPYTEPVPWYAAYQAKLNQRRFDEAEIFFGYFLKSIRDIEGARVGELLSAYSTHGAR